MNKNNMNKTRKTPQATLHIGDCSELLPTLKDNHAHMILTDPPYFLDGLDHHWEKGKSKKRGTHAVTGLPPGMKFNPQQGQKLQEFLEPIAEQMLRILKPGGFLLVFSSPRLYHRMAIAIENAGFEIRDQYAWRFRHKSQFKAFSMNHFIKKRNDLSPTEKKQLIKKLSGRKTPQLRPQFESILCAQKPKQGTFVDNWMKHETGLIDSQQALTEKIPSTIMTAEKPKKETYNNHLTTKPVKVCEHLIKLFTKPGQIVLDPFLGSGTTCVAAQRTKRHSIGIEINPDYVSIAQKRLEDAKKTGTSKER